MRAHLRFPFSRQTTARHLFAQIPDGVRVEEEETLHQDGQPLKVSVLCISGPEARGHEAIRVVAPSRLALR